MSVEDNQGIERVVDAQPARIRISLFSSKDYTLIFTSERIIVALLTTEMIRAAAQTASAQAQSEGVGFFGQAIASLTSGMSIAQAYLKKQPEAILQENSENFDIVNSTISSITYKRGRSYYDKNDQQQQDPDQLSISAGSQSHRLLLTHVQQPAQFLLMLSGIFGARVRKL